MRWPYVSQDDAATAERFWADKEFKKYAVDVVAGPERRPTYSRTFYAHTRNADRAIEVIKRDVIGLPKRARFRARLWVPKNLGAS
ncbi:hypothetical protein [Achromobacter sp. DH1f]|uniref:hypothetical protein n=1 Tax=Achromobacter sp. DH1f TaxID=1397275 RepID=UPI00046853F8|nr:hypothetical protein [Achromobacter sp. DH1f]